MNTAPQNVCHSWMTYDQNTDTYWTKFKDIDTGNESDYGIVGWEPTGLVPMIVYEGGFPDINCIGGNNSDNNAARDCTFYNISTLNFGSQVTVNWLNHYDDQLYSPKIDKTAPISGLAVVCATPGSTEITLRTTYWPTLSVYTNVATVTSSTSATVTGNLTGLGSAGSASLYFEYGPTTNYGSIVSGNPPSRSNLASFTGNITGLNPNTTYHYRAKAVGNGTVYGDDQQFFTTSGTTYTLAYTAGANGSISGTTPQTVAQGGSGTAVTAQANTGYHFVNWSDSSTANPRTDTNVNADISVTANFAQNSGTAPSVSTNAASNITTNSATLNGNLTNKGSATTVTVSFQYGTSSGNYPYETSSQPMSSTGTFAGYPGGLSAGTTYYYSAKAVGDGVDYGGEQSFTTQTTVDIAAILDSLGSATQVYLYFEYGTTTAYGNIKNAVPPYRTVTGYFDSDWISGLLPGTTYHYRIKAVGNGTTYTTDDVFTTFDLMPPSVATSSAINIASTSARLRSNLTDNGGENPTVHIYWGPTDGGTTAGNWAHDINLGILPTGIFYSDISGLTASTTYYYRCFATNSAGGSWAANSVSLTTSPPPAAPSVTNSSGASNILDISARLNGVITSTGGENPTVHIYWGPVDGGTTIGSWAHDINLGTKPVGTFFSNISGLTAGTQYYYRCYASNSGGSSWATSTASFTTTTAPVKLIGVDAGNPTTGTYPANYFFLYRFQATTAGNVTTFKFKASASGHVKVAIYSDSAGEPGTLLNAVNTSTAVVAGWNDITIPSTAVVSGTYYWLSYSSDAAIGYYQSATGTMRYKTYTYSSFTFPASAGTGFTSRTDRVGLLAGWGW